MVSTAAERPALRPPTLIDLTMGLLLASLLAALVPVAASQAAPDQGASKAPTAAATNPAPPKPFPAEALAIFDRADAVMGGRAAFDAIRSVRLLMETVSSAGPVRVEMRWCAEGGFSLRQSMPERRTDVESATNGRVAWHVNHITGEVTSATPEQVKSPPEVVFVFDVLNPLRKNTWRECTVHHKHPFQGVLADVVTLHGEGEMHLEVFFDPERGLPLGTQRYNSLTEVPNERVLWTGWRQVGPLLLPTEREITARKSINHLTFSVLEFDTLTLADFAPPSAPPRATPPTQPAPPAPAAAPDAGAAK